MHQFPKNFFWGASTAAHQVEGGLTNDHTGWEKQHAEQLAKDAPKHFSNTPSWKAIKHEATNPENYISGAAVDHYGRYKEDVQIIKSLNFNAYRFSIEWSRIEPEQDVWDTAAIEHYRDVIQELKTNGIEPFVTLWHWTSPTWAAEQGGWHTKNTVHLFNRYVEKIVSEFKNEVRFWMPLNEPTVPMGAGYITGDFPPGKHNLITAWRVLKNYIAAHNQAYKTIHQLRPDAMVGIPHAAAGFEPYKNLWHNRIVANIGRYIGNYLLLDRVMPYSDFLGVQYYQTGTIHSFHRKYLSLLRSDLGWEIYPEGIYKFCMRAWERYKKPIIITENGLADYNDSRREQFIREHLSWLSRAIVDGVDVRGYLHWSLLDNLEWNKGFWPKFGLVHVDRATQKRTIRESAKVYAEIVKQNRS